MSEENDNVSVDSGTDVGSMTTEALDALISQGAEGDGEESVAEVATEESAEGGDVVEQATPDAQVPDEKAALLAKIAQLEGEVAKKTTTVDRMGNELGSLRKMEDRLKQLEAEKAQAEATSVDKLVEDPGAAIRKEIQSERRDAEIQQLMQERSRKQAIINNQNFLKQHVPDLDSRWDSIAEVVREDGADPSMVRDRFYEMDTLTVFNLVKRAEMAAKVRELTKQVEELKSKAPDLLNRIDAVSKQGARISGKTSGVSKQTSQSPKDVSQMSIEEIDAILEKAGAIIHH